MLLFLNKDKFHLLKNINNSEKTDKPMTLMQIGCYEYLNNNKHTAQSMFEFINQNQETNITHEDIFSIILTVCIFNGFEDIQYVLNFLSEKCHRYKYSLISII